MREIQTYAPKHTLYVALFLVLQKTKNSLPKPLKVLQIDPWECTCIRSVILKREIHSSEQRFFSKNSVPDISDISNGIR